MNTPTTDTTHECPCGCRGRVPRHQLACKPGWFRLPRHLRNAVNDTYYTRTHTRDPDKRSAAVVAHRKALEMAFDWYERHPRPS